jgi:hypothetical protein
LKLSSFSQSKTVTRSASSSSLRDELIDAVSLALICGGVALDIELVEGWCFEPLNNRLESMQ